MEKVAEKLDGNKLGGNPKTLTSTLPPMDCNEDGFTETTAPMESSITEKKGDVQEIVIPLDAVTETMTAKTFTEDGARTLNVAKVIDVFDGSKNELRIFVGISSNGDGREKEILADKPTGKFLIFNDISDN